MKLFWTTCAGEDRHQAARELLEKAYGEICGGPLPQILTTPRGKPYFSGSDLHFSLAHTRTHVFCVLSRENVGLDAEAADRPISPAFARRYLSPGEQQRLPSAPDTRDALLRLFVLKESYAKLTGRGWGNYLKNTDFDPFSPLIQTIDGHYVAVLTQQEANYAL